MKGTAYYADGGDCAYSFKSSTITVLPAKVEAGKKADPNADPSGYLLTYSSE